MRWGGGGAGAHKAVLIYNVPIAHRAKIILVTHAATTILKQRRPRRRGGEQRAGGAAVGLPGPLRWGGQGCVQCNGHIYRERQRFYIIPFPCMPLPKQGLILSPPPPPKKTIPRPKGPVHRRPHHHARHPPRALHRGARARLRPMARAPGGVPRLRRHAVLRRPLPAHPPAPRLAVQPPLPVWVLRLCLLLGGAGVNVFFGGGGEVWMCVLSFCFSWVGVTRRHKPVWGVRKERECE